MTKNILFEPIFRIHSSQRELINFPPNGYRFIVNESDSKIPSSIAKESLLSKTQPAIERLIPLTLSLSLLKSSFVKIPANVDLIYSYNHVVFRQRPWIIFVEWVHTLVGRDINQFKRYRGLIEQLLASRQCKCVITWCSSAKDSILMNLNCKPFEEKIRVIPLAVHRKEFNKTYTDDKVRILFVGSINTSSAYYDFVSKGGLEVLRVIDRICRKYRNVEVVLRAQIPYELKDRCREIPNLRIIEGFLDQKELTEEYLAADIFFQPTHITPFGAFLEAMSFELPVLTRHGFLNFELIEDGKTGFVVKGSRDIQYFWNDDELKLIPMGATPKKAEFEAQVQAIDQSMTVEFEKKLSLLIEDPNLRRRMGKAGRYEIERGRFSIEKRNEALLKVFEEATR